MIYGRRKENLSFKTNECIKEKLMYASKSLGMNLSNVCEAIISCVLSFVEGRVDSEKMTFLSNYWSIVKGNCDEGKRVSTISLRIEPERKAELMRLIEKMKAVGICNTTSSCLHELFRRSLNKSEFIKLVSLVEGFTYDSDVNGNEWWEKDWFEESSGEGN